MTFVAGMSGSYGGAPNVLSVETLTTPASTISLIDTTIPVGMAWRICAAHVLTRSWGRFTLKVNGNLIGAGLTGPDQGSTPKWEAAPYLSAIAGDRIKVDFTQSNGTYQTDISAFLYYME